MSVEITVYIAARRGCGIAGVAALLAEARGHLRIAICWQSANEANMLYQNMYVFNIAIIGNTN